MGKTIKQLIEEIHQNAVEHGWWETEREFGTIIALCHSELSEALEEHRDSKPQFYCKWYTRVRCGNCIRQRENCGFVKEKPEGIAIELADCIIRILDYCGYAGIDIEQAIEIKNEYNKSRPYRHGGKVC